MLNSRWPNIAALYLTAFVLGLTFVLIPASSFILKSNQIRAVSDIQYGFLFLPMMSTAILTTLFFKSALKHLGSEFLFNVGFMCLALSLGFVWMVTSTAGKTNLGFIYLLVSNFFLGIGFAWLISIVTLIFTEEYAAKRDSAIIGLHLCLGLGSASCPIIINYFYSQKMWAMSIMIYLILLGIVFACSMAMGLANLREADEKSESAPSVKSKMPKGAQLFLLAVFIYGIVEGLLGIWSYFYLAQVKMFTMKTVATSIAFFWLFVTLGRLVKSIVALKLDARFLYRLSPVLMVLSFAGICFIQTESQMVLCYMAAGLACSAFFPLTVSLSTRYFYEERDKLCSLSVAVLMLGSLVGSVGVGLLQSVPGFQLSFAFQATIPAALLLLVLSLKLTPQGAKPASAQPA